MKKRNWFQIGRDASTGRFIPLFQARKHPGTTVIETIAVSTRRRVAVARKRRRK